VELKRARHHWGPNLAEYHYLEKRYGRKTRAQVFWSTTGVILLFVGSLVVVRIGETDTQRKARIQGEQAFYLRIVCKLGENACAVAQEDMRKVTCKPATWVPGRFARDQNLR
jgi:hypothetical protein